MDELVRPHNPITDHNSAFSGITADLLEGVATRLADAQALVRQHVPAQALLVGHALDNDLAALKLHHRRLLDTSVMFQHPKVGRLPCTCTWRRRGWTVCLSPLEAASFGGSGQVWVLPVMCQHTVLASHTDAPACVQVFLQKEGPQC